MNPRAALCAFLLLVGAGQAAAQVSVLNTARIQPPAGTTDANDGNDEQGVTVAVYAVTISKTGSPASGNPVAAGDTVGFNLNVVVTGATTTGTTVFTDTLSAGLTLVPGSLPAACNGNGQVITCTLPANTAPGTTQWSYQAQVDVGATGTVGNSVTGGQGCTSGLSCVTTHAVYPSISLGKAWVNGPSGDAVDLAISGAGGSVIVIGGGSSTNGGATTLATAGGAAGATVTLTETFSTGEADNYAISAACTRTADGGSVAVSGSGPSATVTMPADSGIACTFTNTRRQATLTLVKQWVDARAGETATVLSAGFSNAATSGLSTSTGNNTTTGSPATVYAGEVGTLSETLSDSANYVSTLACTGNTQPLSGGTLTIDPADTAIVCTYTNARRSATLTLSKAWVDGLPGDTATVSTTGFENPASSGLSTSTGSNTTTGAAVTVYAGESGNIGEVLSNPGNYDATLACTGNAQPLNGSALTIDPADTAISCTQTNTRRAVSLTLRKTWLDAAVGETVTVDATGSTTGPISLASTADSASETDAGTAVQVYAGEAITLSETFAVPGNAANYTSTLACTGTSGLSGNVLTVGQGDTGIVCTYTNQRPQATLQLVKQWAPDSLNGDVAQLGATTGLQNNTNAFTSTASISGNSSVVTVYVGEQAVLPAETMTGGSLANYAVSVSCTGGSLGGADGKAANTLSVLPADAGTAVVCTYTNTRNTTTLILQKTWLNGLANDTVTVGGTGLVPLASTATGGASQTDTAAPQTVHAGDVIDLTESFGSVTSNLYNSSLSCTNTAGLVVVTPTTGTLTVGPDDDLPITCTYVNDRRSTELIVRKVWQGGPPATVSIPASTGFANNTPAFTSTSPGPDQVGPVTVYALENGNLGPESFTGGNAGDYSSSLTCDGTDTDPSNGLLIPIADTTTGTPITCTYANTFVPRSSISIDKTTTVTSVTTAGQVVPYQITVNNDGNVPLTNVTVVDPLIAGNLTCTPAIPVASLAPGASINCTGSHTVTQADIDRQGSSDGIDDGSITNTANASGTDPDGTPVNDTDTADTSLPTPSYVAEFGKAGVLADTNGSGAASAGEVITYNFTVTNAGNTTIQSVTIADPLLPGLNCPPGGPIPPGGTLTFGTSPPADIACTGNTYTVTQADVDDRGGGDGDIDNTATATAVAPGGGSVDGNATANVPVDPPAPRLVVDKAASPTLVTAAGQVVDYTITVTNPGNVTVTGINVTDPMPGLSALTCTPTAPFSLAPGASATCTATYTVTQDDLDNRGSISNTATATGDYDGTPVTDDDGATVIINPGTVAAELVKIADRASVNVAGDLITYTFRVNNPSTITLENLQVTGDTLLDGLACTAIPSLAPGASADFSCTGNVYTVLQSDIDNQGNPTLDSGNIHNEVTGQADYQIGTNPVVTITDVASADVSLPQRVPGIFLDKNSDVGSVSGPGQSIAYSFTVQNTGNVTLTNVVVTDPLLPSLSCPPIASLAPGATIVVSACVGITYVVTQADIDSGSSDSIPGNGQIDNVATVTANTPVAGATVSDTGEHEVNLPVRGPQMTVVKSADVTNVSAPGTINYRFTVTNTGNVTLTGVGVTDPTLGLACPTLDLVPGQSAVFGGAGSDVVCTGTTRTVTQADIDAGGSLDNVAVASGTSEVSGVLNRTGVLNIPVVRSPGLGLTKSANVASVTTPGDVIVYTVTATNSGNTTLENVVVSDPMLPALSCTPASPVATLAPAATVTCQGSYTSTQLDFDSNGGGDQAIDNTATATWTGGSTTASAAVTLPLPNQSLSLLKTAGTPTIAAGRDASVTDAGDTILYTFVVTNTGNQTLSAVAVTDSNIDAAATCDRTVITASGPTSVATCTGVHTITQSEMDNGTVSNTATAAGTPPSSSRVTSAPSQVDVPLAAQPVIVLDKTAGTPTVTGGASATITDAGDTISYAFVVTNNGNVTLNNITVADPLPGTSPIVCPPGPVGPGSSITCSSTVYTINQADMDAGQVVNTAAAQGFPPSGPAVTGDDSTTTPLAASPVITLVKTATPQTYATVGQSIAYAYLVTNTGNVTVSALALTDDRIAGVTCPSTTLAPQASTTCTGTYVITQADLDVGSVTNTATATGTAAQGTLAPVTAQETITAVQTRSLALVKSTSAPSFNSVGATLSYSYLVTNNGNITLTDPVVVTDDRISSVSCPALPAGGLAPNASITCTATYTTTQADLDAGSVVNVASATSGTTVSPTSTVTVNAVQTPALGLDKTTTTSTYDSVGDVLAYSYLVTNTGNITLTAPVTISDDRIVAPATVNCPALPPGGLVPGGTVTCTASYSVTQADLDAGSVTNVATASSGSTTSAQDSVTVTGTQNPALGMAKVVSNAPTPVVLGSVLEYTVTGTNTGNTTLTNVVISDDKITPASTTCASVAPGGTCVLVGTYTVVQADVDAGQVLNIGSGISDTTPRTPSPPTITPVQQLRGLGLDKTSTATTYDSVGDVLPYSYLVTNTGTVTVTAPITVNDDRIIAPATVSCPALPPGGLAPNASITCTASYTVTQADLNSGSVTNTATATDGTSTSAPDSVTIDATQLPAITLDKTASVADSNSDGITGDAGDQITYAFAVQNTGNVRLAPVRVSDPLLPTLVCDVLVLEPGATTTCQATGNAYAITFADETATSVVNTATATGKPPGTLPDATATDTVTTPTQLTPAATTVTKTSQPASGTQVAPNDVITYSVAVTVANATLHEAVTVTDLLGPGLTFVAVAQAGDFTCNAANPLVCSLPVGTTPGVHTLVYTARVDADATGTVRNAVVPTKPAGVDPAPVCSSCSTEHPIVPSQATVTKSADPVSGSFVDRGQGIVFTVTTVIAGSATTQPLLLQDALGAGLNFDTVVAAGAYTCTGALQCTLPAGTLPGSYPLVYRATVDAGASGVVTNTVAASNPPGGDPDPICTSCSTDHTVVQPALETAKTLASNSDPDGNGQVSTGDLLTYTVRATNTGNVPLSNVTIDDPLITPNRQVCASVAPGASCELTGTYTVTQADTDAGTVDNTARITAEPAPGGSPLPPAVCPAGSTDARCTPVLNLPIDRRPALATTKTATLSVDAGTPGKGNIDDVITYAVTATNVGNVTLNNLTINDTLQGSQPVLLDCTPTLLAPGQMASCASYTHTITEAEAGVDGGQLINTVLAQGQPTGAGLSTATATAAAVIAVENKPATLRLTKVAGTREVKRGDLVRYSLTVQNVGDIDLVDGYLIDTPPAGFTYVEGSLQGDDDDHFVTATGQSPLRINDLDIAAGNTARLSYLMRVGAGVRPGTQVNHAQAFAPTNEMASNVATAEVVLGNDPLIDDSLVMGSVFDDRDGDGWQDSAALDKVHVQGGFAPGAYIAGSTTVDRGQGPQPQADASAPLLHGLALGSISARQSPADPPGNHQVVVRQRLRAPEFTDDFVLTNAQGMSVRLDAQGNARVERSGDGAKGLTAAEPSVERRVTEVQGAYVVDYVIANQGIDEAGIPGVRIGSVEGLMVETDQYGRYHLAGIEGGGRARGRNFVLKVDAATLPEGATFTTANPLLRRITPGLPVRFDFGITLPVAVLESSETVELALGEVFFAADSSAIPERYAPVIATMANQVRQHGAGEVLVAANGASAALAYERAEAVRQALLGALGDASRQVTVTTRSDVDDPATLLVGVDQGGALLGTALFDTDKADVRPDTLALLDRVARSLEQRGGGRVVIAGHADVRGPAGYNMQLGLRRAEAVTAALHERLPAAMRDKVTVDLSGDPSTPLDSPAGTKEGR